MKKRAWNVKCRMLILCMIIGIIAVPIEKVNAATMTTDPSEFYWKSSLGNEGNGVIDYDGDIYWCNRAYLATDDTIAKYTNLGWYVELESKAGKTVSFYADKENCLYKSETDGGYGYYLFKLEKEKLIEEVENAGYNLESFFSGDVEVEMNGYVKLYRGSTTLAGPYNLSYSSKLANLLEKMAYYQFTTESQETVKTQYVNKILVIPGTDILETYDVEFYANTTDTVSNIPSNQVKIEDTSLTLSGKTPTRVGYTFQGWGTYASDNTANYQPGEDYSKNAKVSLYAIWKANTYTVQYDGNENTSGSMSSSTMTYDSAQKLSVNTFIKAGYTFTGWSTTSSGKVVYEDGESVKNLSTKDGEVIRLYAQWNAQPILESQDVYMYLEDELEEERFYRDVIAADEEDGDISGKVSFNKEEIQQKLEELKKEVITEDVTFEVEIEYVVVDSYGNMVKDTAVLHIWALYDVAYDVALKEGYVRFISADYIETLEEDSVWRETELFEYLSAVLSSTT